jgi:hypothetical protein
LINLSSQRLSRGHIILCSGRAASAFRAAISFRDQVKQPALLARPEHLVIKSSSRRFSRGRSIF